MKKLLLLSDPPAAPGYLPRVRFLGDFIVRQGWDVTLFTEQYEPLEFAHSYPIETIPMYSGSRFDWLVKTLWTLLTDWHNRVFAKRVLKRVRNSSPYSAVLVSAFSDFPLGAGLRIARALNVPLVCDIRDLDEQVTDSKYQYRHQSRWLMPFRLLYRAIHIRRRNKVLKAAQAITTVSKWHADFIRTINPNVYLMYNGFDDKQFYPQDIHSDTFTISYIGSLFDWQQDALRLVQQAISELSPLPNSQFSIPNSKFPIIHTELGNAIRKSSVMLVLTSKHTKGMLTTKFYEALGCEKPVLCVPSDDGELAQMIRHTNAGIATDDIQAIKSFILDRYHEWQSNGFTRQAVRHRDEFAREQQCKQIINILNNLTNSITNSL